MKIITLVGCGQVGSRHLQALVKMKYPLLIQVVIRSESAIELGKKRINDILIDKETISIEWHNSFDKLKVADLCIVATTAVNRTGILLHLLDSGNKKFLIEKVVCQSESDYIRLLDAIKNVGAKGWVNCYKRYYPFYKKIKDELSGSSHVILKVTGGNHGLGCNAIHFLDLFGYFVCNSNIELNGDFLEEKLLGNRRSRELVEFCGTLVGKTANGNFFDLTFTNSSNASCTISILGEKIRCFVDERIGTAQVALESQDWEWFPREYKNLYISQITTDIAHEIIDTNNCSLASVEESYEYHRALFNVFNRHIKKLTGTFSDICPIT